jgi:hypothetical protein
MVAATTATAPSSVIRFDGIGAVRVGMSLSQLNRALHSAYALPSDAEERSCFWIDVPGESGVVAMILEGQVARVDVVKTNTVTSTAEGIHNGDSEARAIQVYGRRLKIVPYAYDPKYGHYLTLLSADRKYGIRFEALDSKISRYSAGTVKAISFIEGCE